MAEVRPSSSVITLNVNVLNSIIKRQIQAEWIFLNDEMICYLQEIYFRSKDANRLKVKEWNKHST